MRQHLMPRGIGLATPSVCGLSFVSGRVRSGVTRAGVMPASSLLAACGCVPDSTGALAASVWVALRVVLPTTTSATAVRMSGIMPVRPRAAAMLRALLAKAACVARNTKLATKLVIQDPPCACATTRAFWSSAPRCGLP